MENKTIFPSKLFCFFNWSLNNTEQHFNTFSIAEKTCKIVIVSVSTHLSLTPFSLMLLFWYASETKRIV